MSSVDKDDRQYYSPQFLQCPKLPIARIIHQEIHTPIHSFSSLGDLLHLLNGNSDIALHDVGAGGFELVETGDIATGCCDYFVASLEGFEGYEIAKSC